MSLQQTTACIDHASMRDLPVGAHLTTKRAGYMHHGIYVGNGRVIHYAGLSSRLCGGPIEAVSIERFAAGRGIELIQHPHAQYSRFEVAHRAQSRLGERNYRLLTNNCEHLCLWCVFGQGRSAQVEACIRNPVRAVGVLFALVVCKLVGDRIPAQPGRTREIAVAALGDWVARASGRAAIHA
ncbi:lecithin retinol acyltransferase family protein [Paraburkholderia sp. EG304]|uniref:lecithin retinol acyltransferase family protein n=1 Tax=Paraburkholderia sp. EG304 TaxID=3237015 RepID=UPI0039790495